MNSIVLSMNNILNQWKQQHDIFSAISSEFTIEKEFLCFEHKPLCRADEDLVLTSAEFDSESIQFFFTRHRSVILSISWPEDQPPIVSSISFVYLLMRGDHYGQIQSASMQSATQYEPGKESD